MKIAIWWERDDTFDSKRCKFTEGDFSGGGKYKFFAVGWDPPLSVQEISNS